MDLFLLCNKTFKQLFRNGKHPKLAIPTASHTQIPTIVNALGEIFYRTKYRSLIKNTFMILEKLRVNHFSMHY